MTKDLVYRGALTVFASLGLNFMAACRESESAGRAARNITFNRDIAPIIFEQCTTCHRPGQSAPFSFLSYRDVEKRAKQIVMVTKSGFMPPWLPEAGYGDFAFERRLDPEQIRLFESWADQGCEEGAPQDLPALPIFIDGWQLGKPDLVATMPVSYALAPDGVDVFRNFVLEMPDVSGRYVRAVEFRPGNARVVHHALLFVDRTDASRRRERLDDEPGYDGMLASTLECPDGHFLGWTPGKLPSQPNEDLAWRLQEGMDLVLELHLVPTGKPETVKASVGLFFTDKPPKRQPFLLRLGTKAIIIPAGRRNHVVQDSYVLPVGVEVLAIYPHAHYLGKEMKGYATLPDGSNKWLLYISDWDFNWQDDFPYAEPFWLPKGTKLTMWYSYDNSVDNIRNPHNPPRRVFYGPQSTDEMGDLWIQVLPRRNADLGLLQEDVMRHESKQAVSDFQELVNADPGDADKRFGLGEYLRKMGRYDEAVKQFQAAVQLTPDHADAHNNLGALLKQQGMVDQALIHYRLALEARPDFAGAHFNLANLARARGMLDDAINHYQQTLANDPGFVLAHFHLGRLLASKGRFADAEVHLQNAVKASPGNVEALRSLGEVLATLGRHTEAVDSLRRALRVRPDYVQGHYSLAMVFGMSGRRTEALEHYHAATRLKPDWVVPWNTIAWTLATDPDSTKEEREHAFRCAERAAELTQRKDAMVLDTLAASYASAGRFEDAVRTAEDALALAVNANADSLADVFRQRLELYRQGRPFVTQGRPFVTK